MELGWGWERGGWPNELIEAGATGHGHDDESAIVIVLALLNVASKAIPATRYTIHTKSIHMSQYTYTQNKSELRNMIQNIKEKG